jgi:hypothetical protein
MSSPIYQNSPFSSSSTPTQYTDAIQKAEYYKQASQAPSSWHTLLGPRVAQSFVLTIPYGEYHYSLNSDGTCCRFVLINDGDGTFSNAFFNQAILPAVVDGNIAPQDMASFLFPNTLLYFGSLNNCCELGYHTYVYEPASPATGNVEIRWVLNYSSWLSPGLFTVAHSPAQDVTALSHELAESFNDPFLHSDGVHNFVPWWRSGSVCKPDLEVGDVVESLPNQVYPITMNGMTYHPQTVALLQWFEGTKSDAIGGAFSYPDTTVLTSPMVPQKPFCQ